MEINQEILTSLPDMILEWLQQNVLVIDNIIQLAIIAVMLFISILVARKLRPVLQQTLEKFTSLNSVLGKFTRTSLKQLTSIHLVLLLWISLLLYRQFEYSALVIDLILTLLLVWVIIKLASSIILDRFWGYAFSITAWSLAALSILGILAPMLELLDKIGFNIGTLHLSVLLILKAIMLMGIALKVGAWISSYIEGQLERVPRLDPSLRVMIGKVISGIIYFIVILMVLNSIGVDFTALAVFGGALGVGVGFGLQKVVSNLLSGIILLTDRSIKPGDVIQIGEVYGWISSLKGRYVSVVTRDGHEYLIPNEDLITQQVVNLSYSDTRVRLRVPFGVSYKSDPHEVRRLVLEAIKTVPRVLDDPPPVCLLRKFGDSSIDLELRAWIEDPKNGIGNVMSDILFKVWDTLKANGIEIPFPQRDIHIRTK